MLCLRRAMGTASPGHHIGSGSARAPSQTDRCCEYDLSIAELLHFKVLGII